MKKISKENIVDILTVIPKQQGMLFHYLKRQSPQAGWLEEIKTNDRNEGFDLQQVPFRVTLCKHDTNRKMTKKQ
ncbi:MAG: hypothetical protein GY757_17380 [bacterium]|nr:hypothetical protein [bacterium]